MTDSCVICHKTASCLAEKTAVLGQKGSDGINLASIKRGDTIKTSKGQLVHSECRRLYINTLQIEKDTRKSEANLVLNEHCKENVLVKTLRSKETFDFQKQCLFCTQNAKIAERKRTYDTCFVRTSGFEDTLYNQCKNRNDDWAREILGRIESVNDLHAADVIYHRTCYVNFLTNKKIPATFSPIPSQSKRGRPSYLNESFLKVVNWLMEHEDDQVTVSDLVEEMKKHCVHDDDAYSIVHMKKRLLDHFGENIRITTLCGVSGIVTLTKRVETILQSFYNNGNKNNEENEKTNIITAAAKLIKNDIAMFTANNPKSDYYPSSTAISSIEANRNYIPASLRLLLNTVINKPNSDIKILSIGQAINIMQASKPRFQIAPLQIGLGVQLHHHFGSKFLIDLLHSLGYCLAYKEIQRYEKNAAYTQGVNVQGFENGRFIQFVADNVDHDICTLDGRNTFHGMGIIGSMTPASSIQCKPVPRLQVSIEELKEIAKIQIKFYRPQTDSMNELVFQHIQDSCIVDRTTPLDILSKVVWPLRSPIPNWNGMMQMHQSGNFPGKSSITFLPMIDLSSSDLNCIYSTMTFVMEQAQKYNCTPILTFDQPLYWKAFCIRSNLATELDSIILRLGGFHTEMSYLGCVGHIMSGSGIKELLSTIYAPNAVNHMLTGKAVSRAVRAHFLLDTALHALLSNKIFGIGLKEIEQETHDTTNNVHKYSELVKAATELYDNIDNKEFTQLYDNDVMASIIKILSEECEKLKLYRTAKLWLQYIAMIGILKRFIKAERTGDWQLHLQAMNDMLPYFAASGHNHYAKSVYIYLTEMQNLEKTSPSVYSDFMSGHHVIRRSDRYWAGLSTDLVIEQVLMRSVKSTGGLTRGRGMSESQRAQWLLSMPSCAEVNAAMQEITSVGFHTSDQHIETSESRKERDHSDTSKLVTFLIERDPFLKMAELRSIETGVTAESNVNADEALHVGSKVISSLKGTKVNEYIFRKRNQVTTLSVKSCIKIDGEPLHVDPQLLFQRLTTAANCQFEDMSTVFKYELCSYPSSMFEASGLLREPNKPQLADCIWNMGLCGAKFENTNYSKHIIDGGSLIQRIPWTIGDSFFKICSKYNDYVQRRYNDPIIVFDGYPTGPTTKDVTHLRRSKGVVSTNIKFTANMPCKISKEHFLSNTQNKSEFINLLSQELNRAGFKTIHAETDADRLIVNTAVTCAVDDTVVVGEDTDLLVLLCHHANIISKNIYFKSELKNNTLKPTRIWDITKTKTIIGTQACRTLPVVHAMTGCDTTSRLFGIGKGVSLKKFQQLNDKAEVFLKAESEITKSEVIKAGESILSCLYGGLEDENLNLLRFRKFTQKVGTGRTYVNVQSLPPTSNAAINHSLRVYLQCLQWTNDTQNIDPTKWGWYISAEKYMPLKTDLPPAPDALLKVVRCGCKLNCDSKRCSCRKHGLECTIGCGECRGVSCSNSQVPEED